MTGSIPVLSPISYTSNYLRLPAYLMICVPQDDTSAGILGRSDITFEVGPGSILQNELRVRQVIDTPARQTPLDQAPRTIKMVALSALVGAAIASCAFIFGGGQYRTEGTVFLTPALSRAATGSDDPGAQRITMDSFRNGAKSSQVVSQVARSAGLSDAEVRNCLEVAQVGLTNAATVTCTTTSASASRTVVAETSASALRLFADSGVAQLQEQLEVYQDEYDAASDAVAQYVSSTGDAAPDIHYNSVQDQLVKDPGPQSAELQRQLLRLQPIVTEYQNLVSARVRAGNLLQGAQDRLLQLKSVASARTLALNVTVGPTIATRGLNDFVRYALLGAVVGGSVGYLLSLISHARWGRIFRRRRGSSRLEANGTDRFQSEDNASAFSTVRPWPL